MKLKSSLNSAGLKQFFVNHGEKVGLLLALVLTAYTIVCAYEVLPYTKTVKQLQADIDAARNNINTSDQKRMDLKATGIVLPKEGFIVKIDRELITALNPAKFAGIEWNRPLFETKQRRLEPTYLTVRDLRVEFRYAAVDFKNAGVESGAIKPVGEEWIAVTGLIPFEDQTTAYYRAFQNALDQVTNSVPAYQTFEIRRAEVKSLDSNEAIDWNKIEPLKLDEAVAAQVAKWQGIGPDLPPKELTVPVLTEPLPPLSNKEYGAWCSHPGLDIVPAVAEGQEVGAGGVLGAPVAPPPQVAQNKPAEGKPIAKNLLFRFLDFSIESGKRYRYQVRLIIKNPNFRLDPAHLDKPELAEGETRTAPWSAASPAVGVPYLEWFFAGGLKGNGVGGDNEPEITMGVKQWSPQYAAVVMAKYPEILRGARLDSPSIELEFPTPGSAAVSKQMTAFKSGGMLLDFSWERTEFRLSGPPNDRKVNRPAEALVINPRGELIICAQTMDQLLWDDIGSVGIGGAAVRGGGPGGSAGAVVLPAAMSPIVAPAPNAATQPAAAPLTAPAPAATATPSGASPPKLQLKLD